INLAAAKVPDDISNELTNTIEKAIALSYVDSWDRSIAIAHGLEELCEAPEKVSKKKGKRRKKKQAGQEELL
ncbi:MAG: hypothetical protein SXV54_03575, partial [Chloroflexota bacterium]|nr:hypothetical protein [Chloroflexota bacterium]